MQKDTFNTAFRPRDFVEVVGLESESGKQLNGRRGAVLAYIEESGRFEVQASPCQAVRLKPSNLQRLTEQERLQSLQTSLVEALETSPIATQIQHLRETCRNRQCFDDQVQQLIRDTHMTIYIQHGVEAAGHTQTTEMAARLQELSSFGVLGPSDFERGQYLLIQGLESSAGQALNGMPAMVHTWDATKERYQVSLVGEAGQTKAIRAENLEKIPLSDFTSEAQAIEFHCALVEAHMSVAAQKMLRVAAMGQPSEGNLRSASLHIQNPVLNRFGFRSGILGQHQVYQAVSAFGEDSQYCKALVAAFSVAFGCNQVGASPDTIIFLDIDGVLHTLYGNDIFRESCCTLLEFIVRATGASIVLSSTWRTEEAKVDMVNQMLRGRELAAAIGRTKDLGTHREVEICEWLDSNPQVLRWIAIDDQDLVVRCTDSAVRLRGHFVQTDSSFGLRAWDAALAVSFLLSQDAEPMACHLAYLDKNQLDSVSLETHAGNYRCLNPDETEQVRHLHQACSGQALGFEELVEACFINPALKMALIQQKLDSPTAIAELAPATFEAQACFWYDPNDGGGERAVNSAEKRQLKNLYEACRYEIGLPQGPYQPLCDAAGKVIPVEAVAGHQDRRSLHEISQICGIPPHLEKAVKELVRQRRRSTR